MRFQLPLLLISIVSLLGCGASDQADYVSATYREEAFDNAKITVAESKFNLNSGDDGESATTKTPALGDESNPNETNDKAIERKIVYRATVRLVVDDLNFAGSKIADLTASSGGFLASEDLDKSRGTFLSGSWVARVPVAEYRNFLDQITSLGTLETQSQTANDVTAEYVDLTARISNSRRLETRILELLNRNDDKIENVIQVEKELARVRGEIEQTEGKLRLLKNQTSLTTVTIHVREEKNYFPAEQKGFLNRIGTQWQNSVGATFDFGKNVILFGVAIVPTLIALAIGIGFVWVIRKFFFRKNAAGTH